MVVPSVLTLKQVFAIEVEKVKHMQANKKEIPYISKGFLF